MPDTGGAAIGGSINRLVITPFVGR